MTNEKLTAYYNEKGNKYSFCEYEGIKYAMIGHPYLQYLSGTLDSGFHIEMNVYGEKAISPDGDIVYVYWEDDGTEEGNTIDWTKAEILTHTGEKITDEIYPSNLFINLQEEYKTFAI